MNLSNVFLIIGRSIALDSKMNYLCIFILLLVLVLEEFTLTDILL